MTTEITKPNDTEMSTFKPTPNMEKWLYTASRILSKSPTEIARTAGLGKSSWYLWIKDPDFVDWYNDERLSEAVDYMTPNEAYKKCL